MAPHGFAASRKELRGSDSRAARSVFGYTPFPARLRGIASVRPPVPALERKWVESMLQVLIIEPHDELAAAFADVLASANYTPIVRRHVHSLDDIGPRPATIVLRIGHADVSRLPPDRPPIVAIASTDADVEEARRLRCEVVLRGPSEIKRLCEALRSLALA